MPFEIVTDLRETTEILNISITNFGGIFGPRSSTIDANGGSIAIANSSPAPLENAAEFDGVLLTDVVSLQYISIEDGRSVLGEVELQLPDDAIYVLYDVVPYGEAGDRFLINLEQANLEGNFVGNFGIVEVQIGADDVPQILSMDPATGSPFLFEEQAAQFEIYSLGDGRVGYSSVDNPFGDMRVEEIGILAQGDTDLGGAFASDFDGQGQDAFFIALPDGGALQVHYDRGGETIEIELTQLDANGDFVDQSTFSPEDYADVVTGDIDRPTVLVDEDGNIEIRFSGEADGPGADPRFIIEYALADVPVVEPPLPPTEDNDPTEDADILTLSDGDDIIDALGGDDTVFGGDGIDRINGDAGNDVIYGGDGDDAQFNHIDEATEDRESDSFVLRIFGGLYGGEGDDSINGRDGSDEIYGGVGDDDLRGGAGDESYTERPTDIADYAGAEGGIFGGDGNDFIRGNQGEDYLRGGDGNDDMNGGFGNDQVFGDNGDDKLAGFDGNDLVTGGDGNDRLHGGRGDDRVFGGNGDDIVRGAQGNDYVAGNDGSDRLFGGDGADILSGGAGDDILTGGDGADTFGYFVRSFETGETDTDTIKDFVIGEDKILLSGSRGFETAREPDLTFDDIFLSQEDSTAVIQFAETTIRMKGVDVDDLSEDDFLFGV